MQTDNWLGSKNFWLGFSVRQARRQNLPAGGQKPEGEAKNQKGGPHF